MRTDSKMFPAVAAGTASVTTDPHPHCGLGLIASSNGQVNSLMGIGTAHPRCAEIPRTASDQRRLVAALLRTALFFTFALAIGQASANVSDQEYARLTLRFLIKVDGAQRGGALTADEYEDLVRTPLQQMLGRWERRDAREYTSCVSAARVQLIIGMGQQRAASKTWLTDQQNKFNSYLNTCRRAVHR